jgi:hypothetical protein
VRGWVLTALVLGVIGMFRPAAAAPEAEYRSARARQAVTPATAAQVATRMGSFAGKVLELDGVVSGTFAANDTTGFLLRTSDGQMFILQAKATDADVTLGNPVRVLARVPQGGSVMESLAVMLTGARADTGTVGDDGEMAVDERPPVYYDPTDTTPTPKQMDDRRYVFTGQTGLAQSPEVVRLYAAKIKELNGSLSDDTAGRVAYHILAKSEQYGIDPRLTMALVHRESRFNPRAVSPKGALGLGQLMPGTAAGLGVGKPFDIEENLEGTVRYISTQLRTFGRLSLALAAYNAGPGAVRRYNDVPPYRETRNYVRLVWQTYAALAGIDPETGLQIAAK